MSTKSNDNFNTTHFNSKAKQLQQIFEAYSPSFNIVYQCNVFHFLYCRKEIYWDKSCQASMSTILNVAIVHLLVSFILWVWLLLLIRVGRRKYCNNEQTRMKFNVSIHEITFNEKDIRILFYCHTIYFIDAYDDEQRNDKIFLRSLGW